MITKTLIPDYKVPAVTIGKSPTWTRAAWRGLPHFIRFAGNRTREPIPEVLMHDNFRESRNGSGEEAGF